MTPPLTLIRLVEHRPGANNPLAAVLATVDIDTAMVVWEALQQFADNSEDCGAAEQRRADIASALCERLSAAFVAAVEVSS